MAERPEKPTTEKDPALAKFGRPPGSGVYTLFQQRFVELYIDGKKTAAQAYELAGGVGDPTVQSQRLLKRPKVQQAIAAFRAELAENSKYTLEKAMEEANDAAIFAREHKNPNAYVKAVELKAKLSGHMIEKHAHMVGNFSVNISGIDDDKPKELPPVIIDVTPPETDPEDDVDFVNEMQQLPQLPESRKERADISEEDLFS